MDDFIVTEPFAYMSFLRLVSSEAKPKNLTAQDDV